MKVLLSRDMTIIYSLNAHVPVKGVAA